MIPSRSRLGFRSAPYERHSSHSQVDQTTENTSASTGGFQASVQGQPLPRGSLGPTCSEAHGFGNFGVLKDVCRLLGRFFKTRKSLAWTLSHSLIPIRNRLLKIPVQAMTLGLQWIVDKRLWLQIQSGFALPVRGFWCIEADALVPMGFNLHED